jgi:predicted thioesterase
MSEIPIGTKLQKTLLVDNDVAINFLGLEGARVLGTPWMILWMERTCRDCVFPLLDPGHDTVGTQVNVSHLAATPMGMTVTFTAEVTSIEGRRINFKVEARDEKEVCGQGTHQRAIVNIARFAAKMQGKLG